MYRCISFDTIVSDILYLFLYGGVKRLSIYVVCVSSTFLSCQVTICPVCGRFLDMFLTFDA